MPWFILIAPAIANGIREIVAEFGSMLSEPGICGGLVELDFERAAARGREVDGSPGVVFAKARRRADGENAFNFRPSFKLSANYLGLPVNAAKGGNDE